MPDPVYDDFPEFPSGSVSIQFPNAIYERRGAEVTFDNGVVSTRTTTSKGRWKEFTVVMTLNQTDMQTVFDFLVEHELRNIPFRFTHYYLGTGIVRYGKWELPLATAIDGNPAWFRLELPLEGLY